MDKDYDWGWKKYLIWVHNNFDLTQGNEWDRLKEESEKKFASVKEIKENERVIHN